MVTAKEKKEAAAIELAELKAQDAAKEKKEAAAIELAELKAQDDAVIAAINKEAGGIDFMAMESWESVAAQFGGEVIVFEGSQFKVTDKKDLIEVPFMIVDVRAYEGKWGLAVAVCILLENGEKLVFNDGSTGVKQQVLQTVLSKKRKSGIMCPNGLRKSEYTYQRPKGFDDADGFEDIEATTYYIA
jgi:hypothetical protein